MSGTLKGTNNWYRRLVVDKQYIKPFDVVLQRGCYFHKSFSKITLNILSASIKIDVAFNLK